MDKLVPTVAGETMVDQKFKSGDQVYLGIDGNILPEVLASNPKERKNKRNDGNSSMFGNTLTR